MNKMKYIYNVKGRIRIAVEYRNFRRILEERR